MADRHGWGDGFFVELVGSGRVVRGGASSVEEIERELLRVVAERDELEADLDRADNHLRECAVALMDGSEVPAEHEDLVAAVQARAHDLEAEIARLEAALADDVERIVPGVKQRLRERIAAGVEAEA
jgi:hypothetical protein